MPARAPPFSDGGTLAIVPASLDQQASDMAIARLGDGPPALLASTLTLACDAIQEGDWWAEDCQRQGGVQPETQNPR